MYFVFIIQYFVMIFHTRLQQKGDVSTIGYIIFSLKSNKNHLPFGGLSFFWRCSVTLSTLDTGFLQTNGKVRTVKGSLFVGSI